MRSDIQFGQRTERAPEDAQGQWGSAGEEPLTTHEVEAGQGPDGNLARFLFSPYL